MSFSEIFIRRPIATSLLAAAILLAGIAAYFRLAVAPLPRVDFPTISVSAALPGASPETMASAVATPLERRFGRIAGVTEITSVSSVGSTTLTMQFSLDRDVEAAARDVQAAINAAGGELPSNLPSRPNYRKVNPADTPILILSLTSDTLRWRRSSTPPTACSPSAWPRSKGVGQVFVGGGQQPAVRVDVDPSALAATGLGLEDVRTALSQTTVNLPKGSIGGATQATSLTANDQIFGAASYRDVIISYRDGAALRLGDVARVIDDVENNRVAAWADKDRAVLMIVRRQPGANIIDTIQRIEALLPSLGQSISPAVKISIALDRSQTIRASVRDVEESLAISVGLVILVVFLFLRSFRATLIPSVAVPISLVATFGVMYLLNYSLDNLSLMALTISTGFVVDDAIVVTENVTRYLEEGDSPLEAALKGAKQIGFTIVSITVSLLAVFIPILLMGGIIGRLFREFAVTLSVAIAVSALVSLTLTPMMCSQLLKHETPESRGRFYAISERAFEAVLGLYGRGLGWVLRHRGLTLAVTLGTVALTVGLFITIPKGLFPQQDTAFLTGFTEAAQDVSFATMRDRQQAMNAIVRADPDVAHMVSFIGGGPGATGNTGTMFVEPQPLGLRKSSADEVIARLRPKIAQVPGAVLYLQSAQDVRIGGRASRTQYQYTLEDANLEELRAWAPCVLDALRKLPSSRTWPATSRPAASSSTSASIATPPRASASLRRPSTTPSTTPSASARSRPRSPSSTSTGWSWRSSRSSPRTPTRSTRSSCARSPAPRSRSRPSPASRRAWRRSRSPTRGSSPR